MPRSPPTLRWRRRKGVGPADEVGSAAPTDVRPAIVPRTLGSHRHAILELVVADVPYASDLAKVGDGLEASVLLAIGDDALG